MLLATPRLPTGLANFSVGFNGNRDNVRAVAPGNKAARTPRFVKTRNGVEELDTVLLERARRILGFQGVPGALLPDLTWVTLDFSSKW